MIMKFSRLARVALCAAALLFTSTAVLAQKKSKEVNEYPNATRAEPKATMSQREQTDLVKAGDLVNDDKGEQALPLIEKTLQGKKLSKYAEAYAQQLLGRVYWDSDKEDLAIAATQKALEVNALPNNQHFGLMYQLAQMQVQSEKYADALTTLDRFEKETGKTSADQLALKANIAYRLEKYQDAINSMKQAIAMSDKPNESWNQILMASYFELDQYDEAAKLGEANLAKAPDDLRNYKQLATIYINSDNYPKAIEVLSNAKSKGLITASEDYIQLAKLYASADKPKDATAVLKEGLDKGVVTPSLEVYRLQGDMCSQYDDDACSIEAYGKASPLATDGNVDYQLGYMLYYADRNTEAKAALDRAISRGGLRQEGEAYVLLGDIESAQGQDGAALAAWKKAAGYPSTKSMAEQRIKAVQTGVKLKKPTKK
jgi:tetratricopeptide (TPR) repeat protein